MTTSKRTFRMFVEEELGEFAHFLVWAVLEWILILSLYLDGFFAYISNKFANMFELDPPCVMCTRVDHALSGKNPNSYYNESICDAHKKDISSLAYCHLHRKLSDIKTMCEACLLSFATEKESEYDPDKDTDSETNEDDQKTFTKPEKVKDASKNDVEIDGDRCTCCGESLKPKAPSKGYSRSLSSIRSSLLPTSSPRAPSSLFPTSSPRALFPNSSPRATSLFSTSSPRATSLFPTSSPRAFSSLAPTASPRAPWRIEDKNAEPPLTRFSELKFVSNNEPSIGEDEYGLNAYGKQNKEDSKPTTMPSQHDSEEPNEDPTKTPSFIKNNKFFGIPLSESSPRWSTKPPKKSPLEKSDLNLSEPTSDVDPQADGDSLLNQLKKQAQANRNTLVALFMELDEERSAAAVAANNAMAMITRLQAEKAAVQMEALQYQRMMEEQAEYDQEAIQILKDLLVKKEDDVRLLEAELDIYRERYGEIKKGGSDYGDLDGYDCYQDFRARSFSSFGERSEGGSPREEHDFEHERSRLFGMLKNLESNVSYEEDYEDTDMGGSNKARLTRGVSLIRERLQAVEAESGFLKHTAMTLQKGDEGAKLLIEIAEHLRNLHGLEKAEDTNMTYS